jgi:phosphoribosylformimino-5-aminoimidazole carboxamide ribotide isomerase
VIFIPAIDLIGGGCVRLLQGDFSKEVRYPRDPVETALAFRDEGARQIHVVDLDAARGAEGDDLSLNFDVIGKIALKAGIPIEVGGGVRGGPRGRDRVKALLDAGVKWVILGTVLVKDPAETGKLLREFEGRLVAGIDARDGVLRVAGWTESGGIQALEAGRSAKGMGFSRITYTDIARDGMLEGPNLDEIKAMAVETGLPVTASGGVSSLEDLVRLKTLEPFGVTGAIAGKAIYEGKLSVRDACRLLRE